jgi:hypothetical protein
MSGIWNTKRPAIGILAVCLAMGAAPAAALADSHTVLPPDRVDRIGATVPDAPVQLPPDRVDGLGSARFPTEPTPITVVRTVPAGSFDWLAAVSGAAVAMALVLIAGAARIVRTHRLVVGKA